jgi:hypothetical protein
MRWKATLALKGYSNIIVGLTDLSFGDSYTHMFTMVKKDFESLPMLDVGTKPLLDAIHISSEFEIDLANPADDGQLKLVFVVYSIMFCESLRIKPARKQTCDKWPTTT